MGRAALGKNAKAFETTLKALGPVDDALEALVVSCRSLAGVVDAAPSEDWAWREYRLALKNLREAVAADGGDDGEDDGFGDAVRTPVGHT